MPGSPIVSRSEAEQRPTHHQFVPGIGYIVHSGPPEMPQGRSGAGKPCKPPQGTEDGSLHFLQPPNQHPKMPMRWLAKHHCWAPMRHGQGNRLAWSDEHLSAAGWAYMRPVEPDELVPPPEDPVSEPEPVVAEPPPKARRRR